MPLFRPSPASAAGDGPAGPRSNPAGIQTILLATDLGDATEDATNQAIELAVDLQARLLIVSVVEPGHGLSIGGRSRNRPVEERESRALAARAMAERARASGADAAFLVWDGDVAERIVAAAEAEHADLVVVGTHGRTGVERSLLGSVSDLVIRRAPCPVLVVRQGLAGIAGAHEAS